MSNFSPKLEKATNDQLLYMINELSPNFTILASDELTRRTLEKLQDTIRIYNDQSARQTDKLINLTWGIIVLTVLMLLGLVIQIIVAI